MSYEFIASHWFTPGPRQGPINKIVLHTIECPCEPGWAKKAAEIFAKPTATKVSAHYYVDPAAIIQGVRDTDIAWAAPGANADGIQIEQAGRAIFSLGDWTTPNGTALCKQTAALVADLATRYSIPVRFCSAADMLADTNAKGVTTHAEVNRAFHRSDHTDPGPNYPLDYVLIEARALLNVGAAGDVDPQGDDDMLPCVIPVNATADTSGRFDFYRLIDKGSGHWSVKGYNGAKIRDAGGDLDEVAMPYPLNAPPVGMAEHGGFVVVVAEDGGTFAYEMVLA